MSNPDEYSPIDHPSSSDSNSSSSSSSALKNAFAAADPSVARSGVWKTTFNLTKCFIGAASFELPWAVAQSGLWGGIVGILVLGVLSNYTLRMLTWNGHLVEEIQRQRLKQGQSGENKGLLPTAGEHNERSDGENSVNDDTKLLPPTYPDLGRTAFGWPGAFAAWFGVVAMTVGVCGSYMVFIGSAMHCLIGYFSAAVYTLLILPVIILLSWLRTYSFLAPTSLMGILALIFALIVTLTDAAKQTVGPLSSYNQFEILSYPLFLGNAAFLYLIHSVVLPVEQNMLERQNYAKALNRSMAFVTVLNLAFAIVCLLCYGNDVKGNVLDNLSKGTTTTLVRVFLSVDLLFTCALFLFPMSESLERVLFDPALFGSFKVEAKRNVFRALLVLVTAGVALLIPYFQYITGLSGGFGNNLVGIILPPIFYVKLQHIRGYWRPQSDDDGIINGDHRAATHNGEGEGNGDDDAQVNNNTPTSSSFQFSTLPTFKKGEIVACVAVCTFGIIMMVLSTYSFIQAVIEDDSSSEC